MAKARRDLDDAGGPQRQEDDRLVGDVLEREERQRALDGLGLVGRRPAAEAQQIAEQRAVAALAHAMRDHEVLADGHLSEELEPLERAREPEARSALRARAGDVGAVEQHLSGPRSHETRQDSEEGRLAGAVRAHEARDRAFGGGEVDRVERDHAPVLHGHRTRVEQRIASIGRRRTRRLLRRRPSRPLDAGHVASAGSAASASRASRCSCRSRMRFMTSNSTPRGWRARNTAPSPNSSVGM